MTVDVPHDERPQDAETITEVLAALDREGYAGQLRAVAGGRIQCLTCRNEAPAAAFAIERLQRLEGVSDPADMMAVTGVRCPSCGIRGTLLLRYGPESTLEEAEVLRELEDAREGPGVVHVRSDEHQRVAGRPD